MKEIQKLINELKEFETVYDKLKEAKSKTWFDIQNKKIEICELFRDNMLSDITIENNGNSQKIKAKFSQKFTILGGKTKAPEKQKQVIETLIDNGLLEKQKVKYFDGVAVNDQTLQAAFRKATAELIETMKNDNLISIEEIPSIRIQEK